MIKIGIRFYKKEEECIAMDKNTTRRESKNYIVGRGIRDLSKIRRARKESKRKGESRAQKERERMT